MSIKVLHIVGGHCTGGAFKGANILHQALLELNINSKILNDTHHKTTHSFSENLDKNIVYINNNFLNKLFNKIFIYSEKILKSIYLHSPRSTFTLGFFGFDITKLKEYREAHIIHIHWLSQGFINLSSFSKIKKPVIWTMRDMWPFTGGSHYSSDFEKYEKTHLSKMIQNFKKKNFNKNFQFIAISDWLKKEAEKSSVLKNYNIKRIYNNIDIKDFKFIEKNSARFILNIKTKKKIILYGAQNPQSKRKGWNIFVETLEKLDKSKYFVLIFGNFWSQKVLNEIGIEYNNIGFIDDKKKLNAIYSSADLFVASSIQEAFGKTWVEAMACETPVVCFDKTCASEIIDHKINGYVAKNFEAKELKEGIEWLCNNFKSKRFNQNNLRSKIINFDAKFIAKKYIDLYKNSLNNNKI
jgi:glycosyltransferase involved in cell wall biosynthesis